jgi:iron(III) transport system substrate-binding protein
MRVLALAAAAIVLAAAILPARAQSDAKAEWDKLVAAANQEGEVSVAGSRSPDVRRVMIARWKKDFPKIKINYTTGSSTSWMPRMLAERKAGKFLWDVFATGPTGGMSLAHLGALTSIMPLLVLPDLKDPATWQGGFEHMFIDSKNLVATPFVQPVTVWYDTAKVPPEKVKREGMRVLLDPAYKGKILWQDPRIGGPGQNYSFWIRKTLGEDGLKKIIVDQKSVFYNSASEATEALVRGQGDFVIGIQASVLVKFQKMGLGKSIQPFGTTSDVAWVGSGGMVLAAIEHPPHPNAQKLFVNWMMSKDIQDLLSKTDRLNSLRADVPSHTDGGLHLVAGQKYVRTDAESALKEKKGTRRLIREWRPG